MSVLVIAVTGLLVTTLVVVKMRKPKQRAVHNALSLWFGNHFHKRGPIYNKNRDETRQYLRVYGNPGYWSQLLDGT